jgi:hypothetical protein
MTAQSRRLAASVGFSAAIIFASRSAQADVVNGSFEDTAGTFVAGGNNVISLPIGSTLIPGWTVVTSNGAWARNDNPFVPNGATNGSFFLDLTGFDDSAPYAGVTQDVATVPGAAYTLSFDLISFESDFRFAGPVGVTASADLTSAPFVFTPIATSGVQSARFSLPFVATDALTTITIQGTVAGTGAVLTGQFLGLDNVTLIEAIPESSRAVAAAMLALGVVLVGPRFMRRAVERSSSST